MRRLVTVSLAPAAVEISVLVKRFENRDTENENAMKKQIFVIHFKFRHLSISKMPIRPWPKCSPNLFSLDATQRKPSGKDGSWIFFEILDKT